MNEIIYNDGEIELKVSLEQDTIWLTQKQIVEIFDSSKANISEHISFIFKSCELDKDSTVRKFRTVQKEVYHIGASLKDFGKKWFGFSKMDSESFEMMGRLN